MTQSRKTGFIVLVVVLAIILAGLVWYYGRPPAETVTMLDSGDELVTAAEGRIVSGFPEELLLERDAQITASYAINYIGNGMRQPVVTFVSGRNLLDNVEAYRAYLEDNGWTVTHYADALAEDVTFFYANKNGAETNISFVRTEEGPIEVNVAYVAASGAVAGEASGQGS
jgi:hypothetical protein